VAALAQIGAVSAALASLPAVTSVAITATASLAAGFAAAGAGAGAFAAVAVPSLSRVNDALKAQEQAADSAGGATGGAGRSAAQAAQQALALETAERRLADAQRAEKLAQEDLTRAREAGRRALEDMNFSLQDAILSQKDAELAVREAEARLAKVQADPESSALEIERAALSLEQAQQRAEEQEVRTARARKDTAAANKAGVKGTREYQGAVDKLKQAQQQAEQAAQQLKVAQLQQQAAMSGGGGSASKTADAFAGLSKAERRLAKDMAAFNKEYLAWQRALAPDVFPAIHQGLDVMRAGLELAAPLAKSAGKAFTGLGKDAEKALRGPFWTSFVNDLNKEVPSALTALGHTAGNTFKGLAGIIQAFLPYTGSLLERVEDISGEFASWGANLKNTPEFRNFIEYARANGPKVAEVIRNIATFIGKVGEAAGGLVPSGLDFLVTLSRELARMSSEQIAAIAKSVGLVFAAAKVGASLKLGALVLLAETLSQMSPGEIEALGLAIAGTVLAVKGYQAVTGAVEFFRGLSGGIESAGKSAGGAKDKLSGLVGALGKGGVIAGSVAGLALAFDKINDSVEGLNPDVDELARNLAAFGRGGQPAGALLDQLNPKVQSAVGRFENFRESAARLVSDNPFQKISNQVSGFLDSSFGLQLDSGRQAIDNLDKSLASMVSSGNGTAAAQAFARLAQQAAQAGTPVHKLRELFPQYAQSLEGAVPRTADMAANMGLLGVKADPAAAAMARFNDGIDQFNTKTELSQRMLELKSAFDQAKKAIDASAVGMDIAAAKTDKQREAAIRARDMFSGYITKVLEAAKAAGEMAGKTGDAALKSDEARNAFIRQIPQLFALAGKNAEAREQIYKLAEGFGLNRTQADKAAEGVKGVKEVISGLKGKQVTVGVDNKQGLSAIDELRLAILKLTTENVKLRLEAIVRKTEAMGGIERYAAGGLRPQPPAIASKPTVLWGEGVSGKGGKEAFIPYASRFRGRAVGLLNQVASDFGYRLTAATPTTYDVGGVLPTGQSLVYNGTGSPEPVLTDQQWRAMQQATRGSDGPLVQIDEFNAYENQTPQQIAQQLAWLGRSR